MYRNLIMRTVLTVAAFLAFGCAHALAGAVLFGDLSTQLIGQYIAVIAFLAGVAGVLARMIQALYQKIIDDKERRIKELRIRLDEYERPRQEDDPPA